MPRTRIRKTTKGRSDICQYKYAYDEVKNGKSLRNAAQAHDIQTSNRGRKTRKSAIYTHTPEKDVIRKEYEEKQKRLIVKHVKTRIIESPARKTTKTNKGKTKTPPTSLDDEYYCLVCGAPFSESRPGEKWLQCLDCRMWAHEKCTGSSRHYVCHDCQSD